MADFDEEMQRALELSAQEHMATCTTLVLDSETQSSRCDMGSPCQQHWKLPARPQDGVIIQVDTVNQFAQHWAPLIREFSSPSSTCGYMAMANALALQNAVPPGSSWSQAQYHELLQVLRDPSVLDPFMREGMEFVAASRSAWIANHPADFKSEASRSNYLTAWVANYEISDFLRLKATPAAPDSVPVHFVRYNQWPQYSTATHEERARMVEEKRFGGSADSAGQASYGPNDALFVVESFTPQRVLQRPEEFVQRWSGGHCAGKATNTQAASLPVVSHVIAKDLTNAAHLNGKSGIILMFDKDKGRYEVDFGEEQGRKMLKPGNVDITKAPAAPIIFVADLNGHFVTCVAVHLQTTGGDVKPALVVINTTGTRYLDNPTCSLIFDLVYPPL